MKLCNFCGNKNFKNNKVQYIYKHDGKFLVVNQVPCLQCTYCGEQYFKSSILKNIEQEFFAIYTAGKKPKRNIQVPVEEYANI